MSRHEVRQAIAGTALLAVSLLLASLDPHGYAERRQLLELPHCSLPATAVGPEEARGTAILFHGLAANRRTMRALAEALAGMDLQAVAVDWPGHGDSTMAFGTEALDVCAEELLVALQQRGALDPDRTVVVGHSTGGAAALRLADRFPVAATIAISPGVTRLPRRMPPNLLVVTGRWDIPRLVRFADEISDAAGAERMAAEDFRERRAFATVRVPRATHSSLLFDFVVRLLVVNWAANTLEPDWFPAPPNEEGETVGGGETAWDLRVLLGDSAARLAAFVGLLLLFPLGATVAVRAVAARGELQAVGATPLGGTVLRWALAGLLAALALAFWTPLEFLRLYDGDWMASFAFLTGVVLLFLFWRRPERAAVLAGSGWRAVVAAATVAMATMLAFGWWLDWQLYDAWLNAPRWWRFAAAAPFLVTYFLAEEIALGAPANKWRTEVRRYIRFILLRAVLGGLAVAAYFTVGGALLAILLGPYIALGGIAVRLGADALRRRTGSAAAAAVFSAILAAWALAASLPLL